MIKTGQYQFLTEDAKKYIKNYNDIPGIFTIRDNIPLTKRESILGFQGPLDFRFHVLDEQPKLTSPMTLEEAIAQGLIPKKYERWLAENRLSEEELKELEDNRVSRFPTKLMNNSMSFEATLEILQKGPDSNYSKTVKDLIYHHTLMNLKKNI